MTTFYQNIPPIHHLSDIINAAYYQDAPRDWLIALTDVQGSTQAIQNGRYKEVNAVAAASITALLNAAGRIELPFIFGGDGATILIPPELRQAAEAALLGTQVLAKDYFDLHLRVGIVPVQAVLAAGYAVRVARLYVSDNYQQAIFSGGGLSHAETLLKTQPDYLLLSTAATPQADFSGFECRWNAVKTPSEETLAILVMARGSTFDENIPIYQAVLEKIESLYGDRSMRNPISLRNLRMAFNPRSLTTEAKIRRKNTEWRTLWQMWKISVMARFAQIFNIRNWGTYRPILVATTDTEKFDDTLRMIISGTHAQREQLEFYLEAQHQGGKLVYGIHTSTHALMTCIVFDYWGRQVHFVDASGGGYALAAQAMKAQLKEASL